MAQIHPAVWIEHSNKASDQREKERERGTEQELPGHRQRKTIRKQNKKKNQGGIANRNGKEISRPRQSKML